MSEQVSDLKKAYPVSVSFIFIKSFKFVLFFVLACSVLFFISSLIVKIDFFNEIISLILLKKLIVITIIAFILFSKLLYNFVYWLQYNYYLENNYLFLKTGVFLKKEAALPLTGFSEFYLETSFIDLLFGTKNLIIKSTQGDGQEVARIEALKSQTANKLKAHLIEISKKSVTK